MGKPEIPVENQMVWEASENIGCDLRLCNFSILFSLFSWFRYTLKRLVLHPRQIYSFKFTHKISARVVCVNGKYPRFYPVLQLWGFCGFEALYPFLCTRFPLGWFLSMVSTPGSTPYFSYEAFAGVKHYTLFMHKISTRVACVNGEHPLFYPVLQLWGFCGCEALYPFYAQDFHPGGLCQW